jgi:hypothetical protein
MKKSRPHSQQSSPSQGQSNIAPLSKIARILVCLLAGYSINRFEAEDLGDHCLNSTIPVLGNRHGLTIERCWERVPNRFGKPCKVKRYSLPPSEHDKARMVLAYLKHNAESSTEGESNG